MLLGVISLGCVKEIPDQVGNDESQVGNDVILTTTITLADTPGTKALTAAGVKTFAPGDEVAVVYAVPFNDTDWYHGDHSNYATATLSAENISNDGKSAKISVPLGYSDPGGKVRIIYPANMLNTSGFSANDPDDDSNINYAALAVQDGTLASLASNLDLAVYDGDLDERALPGHITLENRLAIGEFTVKDDGGNDITSSITSFTVSDGTDTYTVSRSAGPGPIYVAMKPVSGDLSFSATDASNGYEKSVTAKTLEANKMYPIGVTMAKSFDAIVTPLTFEAITAEAQVSFKLPSNTETGTVQYKLNDGEWTAYTSETAITLANMGDIVQFRGKNSTYFVDTPSSDYGQFSATADCYLYGNIMSLVSDYTTDGNAFASNVTLTGEKTFYRLFRNNTRIKSHASKPLVLPATTLTAYCYYSMFYGCTGLTTAPVLPATTLANYCYNFMFNGCTGLTTTPALPATTLADCCYEYMFRDCTGLTTAPALPATTLAVSCYYSMFSGCTELTTAPVLPATTLTDHCYEYMFYGCTKLSSITCLAEGYIDSNKCNNWVYGVAYTGNFTRAANSYWDRGTSGIPHDWTVVNYVAP